MLKLFDTKQEEPTLKPLVGSLVWAWEKDPSVTSIGQKGLVEYFLDGVIASGPNDKDIEIKDRPVVLKDREGNFLCSQSDTENADTVQTFAYVHRTLHMARRALTNAGISDNFTWQWGDGPISVYPDKGEMENAYYDRESKSLNFFHFQSEVDGSTIYTCRAEDIVAHETGHAVLDGLCPGYMESYLPQTGAMHEAFGDITSIMLLLSGSGTCKQALNCSQGNLLKKDLYLPILAKQFGDGINEHNGLRNANNELTLSQVGTEVHALSQVFTGAIYHILAFKAHSNFNPDKVEPDVTLQDTANQLYQNLLKAFKSGPTHNASFADIAQYLIKYETNPDVRQYIRHEFERRGIDISQKAENVSHATLDNLVDTNYQSCRGTLKSAHAEKLRGEAIQAKRAELDQANERYSFNPTRLIY